jgi:hypothetical protein
MARAIRAAQDVRLKLARAGLDTNQSTPVDTAACAHQARHLMEAGPAWWCVALVGGRLTRSGPFVGLSGRMQDNVTCDKCMVTSSPPPGAEGWEGAIMPYRAAHPLLPSTVCATEDGPVISTLLSLAYLASG